MILRECRSTKPARYVNPSLVGMEVMSVSQTSFSFSVAKFWIKRFGAIGIGVCCGNAKSGAAIRSNHCHIHIFGNCIEPTNAPQPIEIPQKKLAHFCTSFEATRTGLEPATSGSTVRGSNQLSYRAFRGNPSFYWTSSPLCECGLYRPAGPLQAGFGGFAFGYWFLRVPLCR